MKDLLSDSVALLREMVRIPSPSFQEDGVCTMLAARLLEFGLPCVRYGNNLTVLKRGRGPHTLVLDAHIDTVPAAASYTRDPFDPGEDSDTVWGLGSNDDGGSVVAMIAAFRYFYERELPFNLVLALSCEEERSGDDGSQWLYSEKGPFATGELPSPYEVIVGEPTGMRAATSERGLLVLDGTAEGVSGHAARNEGVNALYIALEDIERLRAHSFGRVSEKMGPVRLNVTQIQAGTAHNVIPDNCTFVVDIRPNELYTNAEILEELQGICRSRLKARNLRNRSSATAEDGALMRTVKALGIETYSSPTTSDWVRISADAVKMGPGESARSHKADEFIKVSEIEDAVEKYIKFIESYGNSVE